MNDNLEPMVSKSNKSFRRQRTEVLMYETMNFLLDKYYNTRYNTGVLRLQLNEIINVIKTIHVPVHCKLSGMNILKSLFPFKRKVKTSDI
jgi:hypothetical protein